MAKVSLLGALGNKDHSTQLANYNINKDPIYGDPRPYIYNNVPGTIGFNPSKFLYTKEKIDASTSFNKLFSIANGENLYKTKATFLMNKGAYINDKMISDGYFPIDHKLISGSEMNVYQEGKVYIGYPHDFYGRQLYNNNIYTSRMYFDTDYLGVDSTRTEMSDEDLIAKLNGDFPSMYSSNPAYLQNIRTGFYNNHLKSHGDFSYLDQNLLYTLCYNYKTAKPIVLVSDSPMFFCQEKLKVATNYRICFDQVTRTSIPYYLITTGKTWVFDFVENGKYGSFTYHDNSDPYRHGRNFDFTCEDKNTGLVQNLGQNEFVKERVGLLSDMRHMQRPYDDRYSPSSWHYTYKVPTIFDGRFIIKYFIDNVKSFDAAVAYTGNSQGRELTLANFYKKAGENTLIKQFLKLYNDVNTKFYCLNVIGNYPDPDKGSASAYIRNEYNWINEDGSFIKMNEHEFNSFLCNRYAQSAITSDKSYSIPIHLFSSNKNQFNFGKLNNTQNAQLVSMGVLTQDSWLINLPVIKQEYGIGPDKILDVIEKSWDVPFWTRGDHYNKVRIDRYYNTEDTPVMERSLISDDHYTKAVTKPADLLTSVELDAFLNTDRYTKDYLVSKWLDSSNEKNEQIKDMIDKSNNINLDSIISDEIDKDSNLSSVEKYNLKQSKTLTLNKFRSARSAEQVMNKYHDFKLVFFGLFKDQSPASMIGQARILASNPEQSGIYTALIEAGLSHYEIIEKAYLLKDEFDSTFKCDTFMLCDATDMYNEITIINSLLAEQLKSATSLISDIEQLASGKNVDYKELSKYHDNLMSLTTSMSSAVDTSVNQLREMAENVAKTLPGSYDEKLINRNVENATSFTGDFLKSMSSDPYLAIKQYNQYMKDRTDKIINLASVLNAILDGAVFLIKLPFLALDKLISPQGIITTILNLAVSAAVESVTVIDNIDKINFIHETFISKGLTAYSTIPTVTDDMFTEPSLSAGEYSFIKRKIELPINVNISLNSVVRDRLEQTKTNPIVIDGRDYSYNDYNLNHVLVGGSGYFLPLDPSKNLPLIVPTPDNSGLVLKPDLRDFSPYYPHRGSAWLKFFTQVNQFTKEIQGGPNEYMNRLEKASIHVPISHLTEFSYISFSYILANTAGIAAGIQAGLRGDIISAAFGTIAAYATVFTANAVETGMITARRTRLEEEKSIYTIFSKNYNAIVTDYTNLFAGSYTSIVNYLSSNYIFISTAESISLYHDASPLKQFFLYVKEILALTTNVISMFAVSIMIGNVATKMTYAAKRFMAVRSLRKKHNREIAFYKDEVDGQKQKYDQQISDIENDPNMTPQEKAEQIKQLENAKLELDEFLKNEIELRPVTRAQLNQMVQIKYGLSTPLLVNPIASAIKELADLGINTAKSMLGFNTEFDSFKDKWNQDQTDADNESNTDEGSGMLGPILDASMSLLEYIIRMEKDINIIKKFI